MDSESTATNDMYHHSDDPNETDMYIRGRTRSRSIHANDDDSSSYLLPPAVLAAANNSSQTNGCGRSGESSTSSSQNGGTETGPLQPREVVALQQGLEDAAVSVNATSREDEEERIAADAERRTRMQTIVTPSDGTQSNEHSRRIKLLILGDSGVGKTSLIMRWTQDTYSPCLVSTVGVNFKIKKVNIENELIQVQVWDTAGQQHFHKITTSYYRGAQGILLVYDVTDPRTLENVEYWMKNIRLHATDSVQVALVGNKLDLRTDIMNGKLPYVKDDNGIDLKCVATEHGMEVARKFSVPFYETSAKDSDHVDDAFMTLVTMISESTSPIKLAAGAKALQGLDRKHGSRDTRLSSDRRSISLERVMDGNNNGNKHKKEKKDKKDKDDKCYIS